MLAYVVIFWIFSKNTGKKRRKPKSQHQKVVDLVQNSQRSLSTPCILDIKRL